MACLGKAASLKRIPEVQYTLSSHHQLKLRFGDTWRLPKLHAFWVAPHQQLAVCPLAGTIRSSQEKASNQQWPPTRRSRLVAVQKMMIQDIWICYLILGYLIVYMSFGMLWGVCGLKIERDRGSWGPWVLEYNYCLWTLFHWFS